MTSTAPARAQPPLAVGAPPRPSRPGDREVPAVGRGPQAWGRPNSTLRGARDRAVSFLPRECRVPPRLLFLAHCESEPATRWDCSSWSFGGARRLCCTRAEATRSTPTVESVASHGEGALWRATRAP